MSHDKMSGEISVNRRCFLGIALIRFEYFIGK